MPVKKREAMRQAILNAAALVEAMDLEQLFGEFYAEVGGDANAEQALTEAQSKLVGRIRALDRRPAPGR
ncbi:hypothetical protein ABFG95_24220 [Achromobacter sp. HNDS-1]|uniref:Uncharacterized protein n=1 Tax=Achromobacter sp. HNDS-1 TaxID=3151598 RepID=A0AAU7L7X0_9BURK|nr:hypothetical protein [Achromobacter ruhlandii]MCI1839948.1 hypothetical protein [Achromobacter ruhlandii]